MSPHGHSFAQYAMYSAWKDSKTIKALKTDHKAAHELFSHWPEEKQVGAIKCQQPCSEMSAASLLRVEIVPSPPSYRMFCKTLKLSVANSERVHHHLSPDNGRLGPLSVATGYNVESVSVHCIIISLYI